LNKHALAKLAAAPRGAPAAFFLLQPTFPSSSSTYILGDSTHAKVHAKVESSSKGIDSFLLIFVHAKVESSSKGIDSFLLIFVCC
jgi:hypothetical protein